MLISRLPWFREHKDENCAAIVLRCQPHISPQLHHLQPPRANPHILHRFNLVRWIRNSSGNTWTKLLKKGTLDSIFSVCLRYSRQKRMPKWEGNMRNKLQDWKTKSKRKLTKIISFWILIHTGYASRKRNNSGLRWWLPKEISFSVSRIGRRLSIERVRLVQKSCHPRSDGKNMNQAWGLLQRHVNGNGSTREVKVTLWHFRMRCWGSSKNVFSLLMTMGLQRSALMSLRSRSSAWDSRIAVRRYSIWSWTLMMTDLAKSNSQSSSKLSRIQTVVQMSKQPKLIISSKTCRMAPSEAMTGKNLCLTLIR